LNPDLLKGKKVVGTEGYVLGEVNGLDFDFDNWQAPVFHVILSSDATAELNLKKPFLHKVVISLPTELIKAVGDVITLAQPVRNLKELPEKEVTINPIKINGKKVVSDKGYVVGDVEGLDIEPSNWKVTGLRVGLAEHAAAELGFKNPLVGKVIVIVPTELVSEIGNFITLDKAIEDLKSLVECTKSCQR
jgi:sporulation protein YlmC with PRC-barrel domain